MTPTGALLVYSVCPPCGTNGVYPQVERRAPTSGALRLPKNWSIFFPALVAESAGSDRSVRLDINIGILRVSAAFPVTLPYLLFENGSLLRKCISNFSRASRIFLWYAFAILVRGTAPPTQFLYPPPHTPWGEAEERAAMAAAPTPPGHTRGGAGRGGAGRGVAATQLPSGGLASAILH